MRGPKRKRCDYRLLVHDNFFGFVEFGPGLSKSFRAEKKSGLIRIGDAGKNPTKIRAKIRGPRPRASVFLRARETAEGVTQVGGQEDETDCNEGYFINEALPGLIKAGKKTHFVTVGKRWERTRMRTVIRHQLPVQFSAVWMAPGAHRAQTNRLID